MAAKRIVLAAAEGTGYPVTREDLLTRLEAGGADPDVLTVVQALADASYVSAAELEQRLDDALGVPTADPDGSALAPDPGWRSDPEAGA